MKENQTRLFNRENDRRIQVCLNAPEWAEHARFEEDNEPCDDGRAAISCGNRQGEKPCMV